MHKIFKSNFIVQICMEVLHLVTTHYNPRSHPGIRCLAPWIQVVPGLKLYHQAKRIQSNSTVSADPCCILHTHHPVNGNNGLRNYPSMI